MQHMAKRKTKRNLTDRTMKALKATASGKLEDTWDTIVAGFGVRVSDSGRRTFVLMARYPGSRNPVRRRLGIYGEITLADARAKAVRWKEQIAAGIDPAEAEEAIRRAALRRRANTFGAAVEDYLRLHVIGPNPKKLKQRNGREVRRLLLRTFLPIWGHLPITAITREQVRDVIEDVRDYGTAAMLAKRGVKEKRHNGDAKPTPGQARNLFAYLRAFFSWTIERDDFGLERSPCDRLRAKSILGAQRSSDRTLTDLELFAFWRAALRTPYPYGAVHRMLLLSGLRLNEVADASWSEFDLKEKLWTIPARRMKGTDEKALPHAVPLTADILAILEELPRFKGGDFLFSVTGGTTPIWMNDKIKKRLDARMLRYLRALARMRGEDLAKVKLAPWVNHDLRRTLRSGLSRLRIDHDVKEAVLGHVKPGVVGIYDRYNLADEKRDALEKWAARLRDIVSLPPENVVSFASRDPSSAVGR
jgi:integrase